MRRTILVSLVGTCVLGLSTSAMAAKVTLAWDPNSETDLAGYRIYYGTVAGPPYDGTFANEGPSPVEIPLTSLPDVNAPEYSLTGIPTCEHLHFVATAYDSSGNESGYSAPPVEATIVGKPTNVTVSAGVQEGTLVVTWSLALPADDSGAVDSYRVHYGTTPDGPYDGTDANEGVSPFTPIGSPTVISGLTPGATIYVAVEARCADGVGSVSDALSAVVPGPDCGNGFIETDESCDGNCPTACNDGIACTVDALSGSAADCTASCSFTNITACLHDDGCCPAGCDNNIDNDCSPSCDNNVVEVGETCDPPESCPTSCDDGIICTVDTLTGDAASCSASCSHAPISDCISGDGCCAPGCNNNVDSDCSPNCGNGAIEAGETCDPPSSCPTACNDGIACTNDALVGSAANCGASCSYTPITACANDDGCCPPGCDATVDNDCSASCNNGVVEANETCDPPDSCPTSCDDRIACTTDVMTGSAANCSVSCSHTPITACAYGDDCCPPGCDAATDGDCSLTCGNGVVEGAEVCDPPDSCPTSCDDGNACTTDVMTGSATNCSASCSHTTITACHDNDGCCPPGCHDSDCLAPGAGGVAGPESLVRLEGSCAVSDEQQTATPWWTFALLLAFLLRRRRSRCSASCWRSFLRHSRGASRVPEDTPVVLTRN